MPKKDALLQQLEEALLQNPNDLKIEFKLAKRLTELKKFKKALDHINTILLENPEHKEAQDLQIQIKEIKANAKAKIKKITSTAQKSFAQSHPEGAAAEEDEDELEETGGEDSTSTTPYTPMSTHPNGAGTAAEPEEPQTELTGNKEFEGWELI